MGVERGREWVASLRFALGRIIGRARARNPRSPVCAPPRALPPGLVVGPSSQTITAPPLFFFLLFSHERMLSSRPTPHPTAYHAPHKENLYPSSKTPARGGLAIHKDGGARTVGKGAGAKTPFGKGGGLTAVSKGAMTTGRKGLGASLGPGRAAGQDAEGNIGASLLSTRPPRDAPCCRPSGNGSRLPTYRTRR